MKLIENLQVAQLSQSHVIKVKSFQSFRGVFRTQLKIFAFTSCAFIFDFEKILFIGFHAYLTYFANSCFHCFEKVNTIW